MHAFVALALVSFPARVRVRHSLLPLSAPRASLQWQGDIDELYVFMTTLSPTTVAAHFAGDFWGLSSLSMVLWLRFTEGGGNNAADSSGLGNHMTGGSNGNTWKSATDTGFCQVGYFYSYKTTRLSDPTTPVGTQSFVAVQMTDNCKMHTPTTSAGAHARAEHAQIRHGATRRCSRWH